VMLALSPERVRADRRDAAWPAFQGQALNLEFTGANVAWLTSDFMQSGTWGDATLATAERGRARVDAVVPQLVRILTEISSFEMPEKVPT
jgi:creatinine amidohydrolase